MTSLDLRLNYLKDTADLPLWNDNIGKSWLKGYPSSKYGQYLEEKLGNEKTLRLQYKNENGINGVNAINKLKDHYIYWLEEKLLKKCID